MHLVGDAKEIRRLHNGCTSYTSVKAWMKQWRRWEGPGATDSLCHYRDIGSPFARFFEDVGYKRRIGDILGHLRATLWGAIVVWLF